MLPVTRMNFRFLKPTHYDEQLTVKTTFKEVKGVRIWFSYQLYNSNHELINEAETELAFVGRNTWKPRATPDFVVQAVIHNQKL